MVTERFSAIIQKPIEKCYQVFVDKKRIRQHPYQPLLERTVGFSISVQYWNVSTGAHAVYNHVQLWRHSHSQNWGQLRVSVADQPTEQTGANKGTACQHRWHDPPSGLELPKVSLMEKDSGFEINLLLLGVQALMLIMCLCLKGTWGKVGQWNILLTSTPSVCHRRTQSEQTWPRCFWATGRILCKFCDYMGENLSHPRYTSHNNFFLQKKKLWGAQVMIDHAHSQFIFITNCHSPKPIIKAYSHQK